MGIFNLFKSKETIKAEKILKFIFSGWESELFLSIIKSTPDPLAMRVVVDYICVCYSITICFFTALKNKNPNHFKIVIEIFQKDMFSALERMRKNITIDMVDLIVDRQEQNTFLSKGWKLDEKTDIFSVIDTIIDQRGQRYVQAINSGFEKSNESNEGAMLTGQLMQETKKSCINEEAGENKNSYPYLELKSIYNTCIAEIFKMCAEP